MRPDEQRALLNRRSFEPFRLHLSNGVTFDVRRPRLMVVGRSIAWLQLESGKRPVPIGGRLVAISLLHIVWVEFITGEVRFDLT